MKHRSLILGLFSVLVLAQWLVPGAMVRQQEQALHRGREFKFECGPVDPSDPFRGRYVRISVPQATLQEKVDVPEKRLTAAFALLEPDEQGFAVVKAVSLERPAGTDYLRVKIRPGRGSRTDVLFPFERYYMEESAAPQAEKLHNLRERDERSHITVRVYKGVGVISGLYLNDTRIEELISS